MLNGLRFPNPEPVNPSNDGVKLDFPRTPVAQSPAISPARAGAKLAFAAEQLRHLPHQCDRWH
jgi:hypothetical protein